MYQDPPLLKLALWFAGAAPKCRCCGTEQGELHFDDCFATFLVGTGDFWDVQRDWEIKFQHDLKPGELIGVAS